MPKARFDIPTQIPASVQRPLQAGVGATDRVVAAVRDAVSDVSKSVSGLDYQPQALREKATEIVTAHLDTLTKDAQARRKVVEKRVADLQGEAKAIPARLQKLVDDPMTSAGDAYNELVKRGETLVERIRRQPSTKATVKSAKTTEVKAKTTRTQAAKTTKSAAKKSTTAAKKTARKSPAKSSAKGTATAAKKTAKSAATATADAAKKVGD